LEDAFRAKVEVGPLERLANAVAALTDSSEAGSTMIGLEGVGEQANRLSWILCGIDWKPATTIPAFSSTPGHAKPVAVSPFSSERRSSVGEVIVGIPD
jgi:hypothetical protein